jgi:hypothetical protein
MALVNPNIAMSYRAPEIQQPNMLADYAAIQQIQGGQQAQQLNALKMQEYERIRGEEEGARNFLRGRDLTLPETRTGLTQFGKTGLAIAKSLSEQDAATLNMQNIKSQISERDFGLQDKKLKFAWGAVGDATTPELAIQKIADGIKDGVFSQQDGAAEIQQLQNMTPDGFRQYRVNKVLQLLDAKDKLGAMLPKIARQEAGGQIVSIQDNPALPGYGLPVAGMAAIAKTETFADVNARKRLAFDQNKFNWEKANPGFELKEAEDGTTYGVNKNTLQAFPVTIGGGAAPASAPAAGGTGMPSARVPAPQAPLAGATPTAAKQFRGKGQGMTEGERKASTLLQRLQFSEGQLTKALVDDPDAAKPGVFTSALDVLSTPLANTLTPEARQRVQSAQLDILDAALTLGTGAAYTKEQLEGYRSSYFPAIGDGPTQVKDKKARLQNVISAAKIAAGKGAKLIPDTSSGANANDPLGLLGGK